ncbi:DUF6920 family protein [Nostoc sp. 2RC]|uniref:DUF6920 family protein n=1 Tax=Nostoc sp. 2RC TaxID=2485484 RepID=UPI001626F1CA|nr:DUF6544 family protein [Nostoc sp. 2RC]MBC1238010.1 hypothetical protein [Nostoc sp. 2RC]
MLTKIFLYFGALLGIAFIILAIVQLKNEQQVDRIWRSLPGIPTGDRFTKDMVAELPPPVQRYFLHSIAPGTSLASSVCLEMSGSFRMVQDQPWIPMRAKQITSVLKGFVWKAVIDNGWFKFMGADYYANKCGGMCFSLWGLIPLVNARSSDITRSSIGRFAGEFFWLPSALLPQHNVNWKAIDERTIQANFKIDGERIILTLIIDVDGKLLKLFFPRWGQHISDGSYSYIPFGGEFTEERTFSGFTIPSQLVAGWWFGTDNYSEFFRAKIERAEFY